MPQASLLFRTIAYQKKLLASTKNIKMTKGDLNICAMHNLELCWQLVKDRS